MIAAVSFPLNFSPSSITAATAITAGVVLVRIPADKAVVNLSPRRVNSLKKTIPKSAWKNMYLRSHFLNDSNSRTLNSWTGIMKTRENSRLIKPIRNTE